MTGAMFGSTSLDPVEDLLLHNRAIVFGCAVRSRMVRFWNATTGWKQRTSCKTVKFTFFCKPYVNMAVPHFFAAFFRWNKGPNQQVLLRCPNYPGWNAFCSNAKLLVDCQQQARCSFKVFVILLGNDMFCKISQSCQVFNCCRQLLQNHRKYPSVFVAQVFLFCTSWPLFKLADQKSR